MSDIRQTQRAIDELISAAATGLAGDITYTQRSIFSRLLELLKDLELNSDGTIKQVAENLEIALKIRGEIDRIVLTRDYRVRVSEYTDVFKDIKAINDQYFKTLSAAYRVSDPLWKAIEKNAINITVESFTGAGLDEHLIKPLQNMINQNITTGGKFTNLVEQLRAEILGDEEHLGRYERYVSQIAWDGVSQFNRVLGSAVASNTGLVWCRYSDGLTKDSRDYCIERVGQYFHVKEVEESADEEWAGKNPETNSDTIFIYAGGYNCKHHYTFCDIDVVPQDVIERNIASGNYIPEEEFTEQ